MTTPDHLPLPTPMRTEPSKPVAFETQHIGGEVRRRHNVAVTKIPRAARTTIRTILPDEAAVTERGFNPGLGGDTPDDHIEFPAGDPVELDGARVWYSLLLTDDEVAALRAENNVRAVTLDTEHRPI